MLGFLVKAKAFNAEGITAFIYSGGYNVPPVTLTGSVRKDMLLVAEVIGAGEIAISDARSTEPSNPELGRLVRDAYVGGLLTANPALLTSTSVRAEEDWLPCALFWRSTKSNLHLSIPLPVEPNEALCRGSGFVPESVTVDVDTVEEDLPRGLPSTLSEAAIPPASLYLRMQP